MTIPLLLCIILALCGLSAWATWYGACRYYGFCDHTFRRVVDIQWGSLLACTKCKRKYTIKRPEEDTI